MNLSFTEKTTLHVDSFQFEEFVKSQGGERYDFVSSEECGNDSSHEFFASGEKPDSYDLEKAEAVLRGEWKASCTGALFEYFAWKGLIPSGEYIVSVCW